MCVAQAKPLLCNCLLNWQKDSAGCDPPAVFVHSCILLGPILQPALPHLCEVAKIIQSTQIPVTHLCLPAAIGATKRVVIVISDNILSQR